MAVDTLAVLIDDDDVSARLLSLELSVAGIEVVRRDSIGAALAVLPLLEPDFVLTDLPGSAPRENPVAALKRAWPSPIIVISARRENAEKLERLAPGATAYFSKPFDPVLLIQRLAD